MLRQTSIPALDNIPPWDGKKSFGLETPRKLLSALGNPENKVKTIHIAGTNGKGSVSALCSAMIHAEGYKVGQFSTPYLSEVNEVCIINGLPCEFSSFRDSIEQVAAVARENNLTPSFFELNTIASFLQFERENVDWAVIEVGLGGRLDATNCIQKPEISIITTIGIDHVELLGDTVVKIAAEKAGILRENVPTVLGRIEGAALETILKRAAETKSKTHLLEREFGFKSDQKTFYFSNGTKNILVEEMALKGKHQRDNLAVALRTAKLIGLSDQACLLGALTVRWPGRLEFFPSFKQRPAILLDAAHNEDGMKALLDYLSEFLEENKQYTKLRFICSILATKEWQKMLEMFKNAMRRLEKDRQIECKISFTTSGLSHAVSPENLAKIYGWGDVYAQPEDAFTDALDHKEDCLIVVSGSIYLLGIIRPLISGTQFRTIAQ